MQGSPSVLPDRAGHEYPPNAGQQPLENGEVDNLLIDPADTPTILENFSLQTISTSYPPHSKPCSSNNC